jgi:mannose/fructose/N-acetylgalactosamine-specific phosphotransferase system component IID
MSIIPPSGSLVRFDNPQLITAQHEKDRKGLGASKQQTALDQQMMDVTGGGTNSPQLGRKQTMKDLSLEEILDKILPPRLNSLFHFLCIHFLYIELQKIQIIPIYSIVNVYHQHPLLVSM